MQGGIVLLILAALYACGGGGSSNNSSSSSQSSESKPVATGKNSAGITLYDDPKKLAGADANNNGIADAAEPRVSEVTAIVVKQIPSATSNVAVIEEATRVYLKDLNSLLLTPNANLPTTPLEAAQVLSNAGSNSFCLLKDINKGDFYFSNVERIAINTEEQKKRFQELKNLEINYIEQTGKFIPIVCN